jgi:Tfp pilus assembly protein PilF
MLLSLRSRGTFVKVALRQCKNGFSVLFIILSTLVIIIFTLTAIVTIRHIIFNYKPSSKTVDRLIRKGKIDEAYSFSEKLDESSVEQLIAKAKVLIAISLKNQENNQWRDFGINTTNWLDDASSIRAVELLETALQLDSCAADAYCLLGVVQKEMGKLETAELNLRRAINLNCTNYECFLALASLYSQQEKFSDAEQILRNAVQLFPGNVSAMKNMGYLYRYYIQKPESAIVWMNNYLSNTSSEDRSSGDVKHELRDLLQRYPEYASVDTSAWGTTRKFSQRKDTPFHR